MRFQKEIDLNYQFFVFLHNNLIIMRCAIFLLVFFHEFFEDIKSNNLFEKHLKIFESHRKVQQTQV